METFFTVDLDKEHTEEQISPGICATLHKYFRTPPKGPLWTVVVEQTI